MEEWQTTIVVERCDLYIRIVTLGLWLRGANFGVELEQKQYDIMEKYLMVLDDRIARFQ